MELRLYLEKQAVEDFKYIKEDICLENKTPFAELITALNIREIDYMKISQKHFKV